MIVYPRSSWTSVPARGNTGSDETDGMPNFQLSQLLGICVHYGGMSGTLQDKDPSAVLEAIRKNDMGAKGYGDIMYNLAVAGNVEGIYSCRGLVNKGAANGNTDTNAKYVSILCLLGAEEIPTDVMLNNLRYARELILNKYPGKEVCVNHSELRPTACPGPYLSPLTHNKEFWKGETFPPPPPTPVPFNCPCPPAPLKEGDHNVHVQDLQNQLAFWGYYTVRADGVYGPVTRNAVRELQNDLKAAGKYPKAIDGQYGQYTKDGWCSYLNDLWNMANPS